MTHFDANIRTLNLTRAQLDVWMAHQFFRDPSVLNVPSVVDIRGPVDGPALSRAFEGLVASSETLRTVILQEEGPPAARVLPAVDASIDDVEMAVDSDQAVTGWLAERVRRPLRLDTRIFDAAMLRVAGNRTVLFLNVHHIVTDSTSQRLLISSLSSLYERALTGDIGIPTPLPPFSEYLEYEEAQSVSDERERAQQYWLEFKKERAGVPALYGRLPRQDRSRGFRVHCPIGEKRSAALYRAGEQLRSGSDSLDRSVLAIITTCLATWEWRVSGASPLAIGVAYHNRPPAFRATPGLFVNIVPVLVPVAGNVRFDEIVASVQADLRQAFRHGHYPLAHSMHTPLYHAAVNYQVHRLVTTFGGSSAVQPALFTGRLDEIVGLELYRDPVTNAFEVDFDLDGDIFFGDQSRSAIQHFLYIVDACLENPQQTISRPDIVSDGERQQILAWSHGPRMELAESSCVDVIERRARELPAAIAVVDGDHTMSYCHLTSAALRLARRLRQAGVTAGTRVGVVSERSIEGMTAILSVLRAGGAYLPLDRDWPDARLSFILKDAAVRYVLAPRGYRQRIKRIAPDALVIPFDGGAPGGEAATCDDLPSPARNDVAYVIFTSGSTGQPKGVEVTHGALVNHCAASIRAYGLTCLDRVMQFHALTFDTSLEELLPTWCAGATVVLRPSDVVADVEALETFIGARNVTVVNLPTSFWHEWTRMLLRRNALWPASVRILIVGGEQPHAQVYANWRRHVGEAVRWVNGYGPTEAAVTATVYEPAVGTADDPIPMGRPVGNASAYVFDRNRRLVPLGVPGELYIGGQGVAKGYVNRPLLTDERFVCDDTDGNAECLYRTGDLARMRDDGQFEYLGRTDNQVKVHGYRIEPGEIETVLSRAPGVSECVVATCDDRVGEKRLIAYVVPTASQTAVDLAVLRNYMREILPEYMIPSAIVTLEQFPLTSSGKVDRASLPVPASAESTPAASYVQPRTRREEALANIWEEMLEYKPVGVHDNFFLSGGDSLMTVGLICEIERTLGVSLTLRDLYQNPTVEQLAKVILEREGNRKRVPSVFKMQVGPAEPAIFFIYASSWELRLARLLGPTWSVYGIEVPLSQKWADAAAQYRTSAMPTMQEFVAPFVALLRAHPHAKRCVLAGFSFAGLMAFEAAHQFQRQGGNVEMVILLDSLPESPGLVRVLKQSFKQMGDQRRVWPAALKNAWHHFRERVVEERDRALSLTRPAGEPEDGEEAGWFTGVYDEEGRIVSSRVLGRLYKRAERAYRLYPLDCRGVVLLAEDAPEEYRCDVDGHLAWKDLFKDGFDTIRVQGNHKTMIEDEQNALKLAHQIKTALDGLSNPATAR